MDEAGKPSKFAEFERAVTCLPLEASDALRAKFLAAFVDMSRPRFPELIECRQHFKDGDFYTGYLWDFLSNFTLVTEEQVWANVATIDAEINAMWDLHSSERILVPGYWNFPRHAVLKGSPTVIRDGASFLPEDLYLFDETFVWCAALTHEYSDESDERISSIRPSYVTSAHIVRLSRMC